jgi:hypothetical protein
MRSRLSFALPCLLSWLLSASAWAQEAAPAATDARQVMSIEQGKQLEAEAPAIPIFYGQSYEGRLSLDNGTKTGWRKQSTFKYVPSPLPVAYYYIDMFEKEELTLGFWTDTDKSIQINVTYEKIDRKGNRSWEVALGGYMAFSGKNRCVIRFQATKARRYRFEVFPQEMDVEANYKIFVLPKYEYTACDDKISAQAQAYFDAPGQPASLAIAQGWKDKPFVPALPAPAIYTAAISDQARAYAQDKPEALRGYYEALYTDGEHSAVLNFERLGLAAMEAGEYAQAEWAFDQALARIEAFFGQSDTARAARSKWASEGIKDFKGEPYERVMAYYYRGLLYLRAGDYDNARAAFTAGEFQDTLSEAEEFQGDFALMNYLAGWASYCGGDNGLAGDAFALAEQVNPAITRPSVETTLVVAELGQGPVKFGRGLSGRLLTFVEAQDNGLDEQALLTSGSGKNKQTLPLSEYSNLSFQATTRGGRAFDAILDGKASLQNGMRNSAEVGYLMTQSGVLPLQVAGLLITAISAGVHGQVKPDADVRLWDTLPHHVAVGVSKQKPTTPMTLAFTGTHALPTGTPVMQAQAGKCGIVWSRSRSALKAGPGVPGNDEEIVAARAKKPEAQQRDAAFRLALQEGGAGDQGAVGAP